MRDEEVTEAQGGWRLGCGGWGSGGAGGMGDGGNRGWGWDLGPGGWRRVGCSSLGDMVVGGIVAPGSSVQEGSPSESLAS